MLDCIASYGDLIQAFGTNTVAAERHFTTRDRHASFDGLDYIASHGDRIQAFGANAQAGEQHFIQYGYNEGRTNQIFKPAASDGWRLRWRMPP